MIETLDENPIKHERTFGLTMLCIITFFNVLHLLTGDFEYNIEGELYYMTLPFLFSLSFILTGTIYYWYLNKAGFYFLIIGMLYPIGISTFFGYSVINYDDFEFSDCIAPLLFIIFCFTFLYVFYRNQKFLSQ